MKQVLLLKTSCSPATRILIFLLFFGAAFSARAGHYLAPDAPPSCVAGFTDSTSDLTVYFTSTSIDTDANTEYRWYFGDGGISHQKNPHHRYKVAAAYTVCLTIINKALLCNDSVCHTVTVTQCVASFDTSVVGNQLTAASTSVITNPSNTFYRWNFGDGGVGKDSSVVHTYKTAGAPICYVPVGLSNLQSSGVGANFVQMITVNSSTFNANESSGLENVEFTTGPAATGTVLQAWIESGNSSSSTNTVYWVNLGTDVIPANTTVNIYMNFMPSAVMSATGPTGEAPQLSTPYAQNDNGALVFPNFYDNFAGTSLASQWTNTGAASVTVNNGLTLGYLSSNWYGIYTNTFSSALNTIAESYCAASDVNGDGLCMNTSGTSGNGVNDGTDGVDAQLDNQYAFGGYGSCTSAPGTNAQLANASPSANTYYIMSFFMLSVPALELNYGADENVTDLGNSGSTGTISATSEVGLGVSGFGVTGSYQWFRDRPYPPNGIMPTSNVYAVICQSATNAYNVCLTIANPLTGCDNTSCETVTTLPLISSCTAAFTDSLSDLAGYFTSTSGGVDPNTTYSWNFGDGSISHVQNPYHKYAGTGSYTVCLTIKNYAIGCFDSICHSITLSQCQAAFDTATTGLLLTATSVSTGVDANTTVHWDFGDGTIGKDSVQNHTYKAAGTYYVCLTIDNSITGCSSTTCDSVKVKSPLSTCIADFKDSTSDLAGYFTSTSTGVDANTIYSWSFGDGTISHLQNPSHEYVSSGTYTVCLSIRNYSTGCFDSVCHSVTFAQCVASFDTTTSGLLLVVKNTSTGVDANTTTHWDFGDGTIGKDTIQDHTYQQPGTYYVCLTISNPVTGCNSMTCDSVKVKTAVSTCQAAFHSSQAGASLQVTFTNTSTGTSAGTIYRWTFGDDSISHQQSPQHNYHQPGKYTVCLTIADTSGAFCSSTACDTITVTSPVSDCTADFTWQNFKGKGEKFTSTSTGTTANTKYTWSLGDGTILKNETAPLHLYATGGRYYVCLTITDSTETYCNSTFCDTIDFVTGIDQLSFPGTSLYYDATASQLVVNWSGADNVAISLVNILGQDMQAIYTGSIHTGLYRFNVNSASFTAGIYFIHITAQDGNRSLKIFVLPH